MRKVNKVIAILISFILGLQLVFTMSASANTRYPLDLPYQPPEQ